MSPDPQPRPIEVLGISGSLRPKSFNTALLRAAIELAPPGMTIAALGLRDIPIYDDDVRLAGYPAPVAELRERMRAADALLFVSPEYNRSIPGVLKNAIDWASRGTDQPFKDKPIAVMGASPGTLGAIFANHHLRQVLMYLGVRMVTGPEVAVANAKAKFDEELRLIDQPTRDFVAAHLVALKELVQRCRAVIRA